MRQKLRRIHNCVQLRPGEAEEALGLVVTRPDPAETVWTGHEPWASGVFHERHLSPGMEMHWGTLHLSSALRVAFEEYPPALCFTGTLAGGWHHRGYFRGRTRDCGQMAGEMGITRVGERGVHTELPGRPFIHLTVGVTEAQVQHWIETEALPQSAAIGHLRRLVRGEGPPALKMDLSAVVRTTIERTIICPYRGTARALALEARANDLVSDLLAAIEDGDPAASRQVILPSHGSVDRMYAAAEILRQRLAEPPSLGELARTVGVSDSKLKRGFQMVFGTTAFGYLRARRMEHARDLLAAGEATVLEAAEFVGYSNPSNFAAAFRGQFGVNPKQFQLTARRRK